MTSAYLDHAASTPMRPAAVAAVVEVLEEVPGNPSGQHRWARDARRRLDDARDAIADAVGAEPGEVVFTSGGTEADHLAVAGVTEAIGGRPACMATDHHAVLEPVRRRGGVVLQVGGRAVVDPTALADQLRHHPDVRLVSFALVNNEVGAVQPALALIEALRRATPAAQVHVDAVAAGGWLDLAPVVAAADLVSISGHKVGGPKGIGALVVRAGTPLTAQLGGSQERERRAGTQHVAGAAGMAVALAEAVAERAVAAPRVAGQRARLRDGLVASGAGRIVETVRWEEEGARPAPHVLHLSCRGVHREALLLRLDRDGVAASAGSSCASGAPQRSHVVEALGVPTGFAEGALRLSLGWSTTDAEIDRALAVVPAAVADLAGTAPDGAQAGSAGR